MRMSVRFATALTAAAASVALGTGVAYANYQADTEKLSVTSTVVAPGGSVTVSGAGFKANSSVKLELHSEPVDLGTTTTDAEGEFTEKVTVPGDTPKGTHTIVAEGVAPDGSVRTVNVEVKVGKSPVTGAFGIVPLALIGGGALAVGGALIITSRKKAAAK